MSGRRGQTDIEIHVGGCLTFARPLGVRDIGTLAICRVDPQD